MSNTSQPPPAAEPSRAIGSMTEDVLPKSTSSSTSSSSSSNDAEQRTKIASEQGILPAAHPTNVASFIAPSPSPATASDGDLSLDVNALPTSTLLALVAPIQLPPRAPAGLFGSQPRKVANWGGTFVAQPVRFFAPRTVAQCLALVELARRQGVELRCVGRGHSPSDLMMTKGWVVLIASLSGLVGIEPNRDTADLPVPGDESSAGPSVEVYAGTYLSDIHTLLREAVPPGSQPLALSNVGSISEQTIGGIIATATHGTGIHFPVLSALVLSLEIVCAFPHSPQATLAASSSSSAAPPPPTDVGTRLVRCSRTERPELFNATLCGLGTTGLITKVKLSVEPAFQLRQMSEQVRFDYLFGQPTNHPAIPARLPLDPTLPAAHISASGAGAAASAHAATAGAGSGAGAVDEEARLVERVHMKPKLGKTTAATGVSSLPTSSSSSSDGSAEEQITSFGRLAKRETFYKLEKGKQSIGRMVAHGRVIPPCHPSLRPSARAADPATSIYPFVAAEQDAATGGIVPLDVATQAQAAEEDDEETRLAQRRIEQVVESAQHVRCMWFPAVGMCTLLRADRTAEVSTSVEDWSSIGSSSGCEAQIKLLFPTHAQPPPKGSDHGFPHEQDLRQGRRTQADRAAALLLAHAPEPARPDSASDSHAHTAVVVLQLHCGRSAGPAHH